MAAAYQKPLGFNRGASPERRIDSISLACDAGDYWQARSTIEAQLPSGVSFSAWLRQLVIDVANGNQPGGLDEVHTDGTEVSLGLLGLDNDDDLDDF